MSDWTSTAIALLEADANRSADTHLHLFPLPVQRAMARIAGLVSAVALAYFAWRLVRIGLTQAAEHTPSASLALPMAPLAFLAAASCAGSAVVMAARRPE